jgi:dextranase
MRILDFYPSRGSFTPGETIQLWIELEAVPTDDTQFRLEFFHLEQPPIVKSFTSGRNAESKNIQFEWLAPITPAGYAVRVELLSKDGEVVSQATTAFDVLDSWTDHPRYGFLSEFNVDRADPDATMQELRRYHINGLQFYDWQFRHDQLVAPMDDYIDPLGRSMSLATIRKLVDSAHQYGMAAMPYLAVYAASAEFWQRHLDWALFDENGKPIPFGENFLGLMNPSPGSPWSSHILQEASRALRVLPFDGLHIDQYGHPRQVWDSQHRVVDLPTAFVEFIRTAREQNRAKAVLFNAVGNWPIEALATAPLDFLYIEIWPPEVEYRHLARIVLDAVDASQGKPVVIALYLPADQMANILVADAVILACGGSRIELGEGRRMLSDPYFPKHQPMDKALEEELHRLYSYTVQYGEWLRGYSLPAQARRTWSQGKLNSKQVVLNDTTWSVIRHRPDGLCITLVNLNGIENQCWNTAHPIPIPITELPVVVEYAHKPKQISWACPEQLHEPQALDFEYDQGKIHFTIKHLRYTGVIYIHD